MDGPVWLSLGSILTSSLVAIAVVWLGARFAARQAHLGRTWERKAAAYSAIFEALHEMEEWFSQELDDEYRGREVDEAVSVARVAGYQAARKLLRRTVAREVWLLPAVVQARSTEMDTALRARHDTWFENIDAGCFEVRRTIADIVILAHSDLDGRKQGVARSLREKNSEVLILRSVDLG